MICREAGSSTATNRSKTPQTPQTQQWRDPLDMQQPATRPSGPAPYLHIGTTQML